MMRTRRPLAALAVTAMVALISACGGSSAPAGTGGGTQTHHSAPSGSRTRTHSGALGRAQAGVKFAACMRHHGVGNFPDPSASGNLTIDAVANGSSVNTNTPAFTQALSACKSLEPAGFTGGTRSASQQAAALRFAQCIRDNGVKDFPDPGIGQPLIDTNRIPSSNSPAGMSILHAAMQKCSGPAAAAGVTR